MVSGMVLVVVVMLGLKKALLLLQGGPPLQVIVHRYQEPFETW